MNGASSVVIGIILLSVATFLARESKGLLPRESASPKVLISVEKILAKNIDVKDWALLQTRHFGPNSILLIVQVDFNKNLELLQVERTIESLRLEIKHEQPSVSQMFIQSAIKIHLKASGDLFPV